jgi:serine/threonine-protein kinase
VGCLDARGLAYLAYDLAGPARDQVDAHLDGCEPCRSLVAAYAQVADDGDVTDGRPIAPELAATVPIATVSAEAAPGSLVGGRYVLDRVVGEGGMGVVWAARDPFTGREFAVKLLKGVSADLCRRFERETRVATTLVHPNVVQVRAVLTMPDGKPALVMDLLRGHSLATELAERGALGEAEAIQVLLPLVSAVRAAHARGIVHRDLKPANVFLAEDDDGTRVVTLLDFGLAKLVAADDAAADKLTRTGAMLGTPRYMSPEQLLGDPATTASDVWAIGVLAFECLTGERPLEGKTLGQLVRAVTRGAVTLLPDGAPLAGVVNAMLAIEPSRRASLAEVHAALDAHGAAAPQAR